MPTPIILIFIATSICAIGGAWLATRRLWW